MADESTIHTLPSGEKVVRSPDGTERLMPTNTLADRLAEKADDYEWFNAEKGHELLSEITTKQEAMDGGNLPVPSDKRSC